MDRHRRTDSEFDRTGDAGLLVIARAPLLYAKRRIASSVADVPGLPDADAAVKDAPRYRLDRGECEANDSGASAPSCIGAQLDAFEATGH